MSIAKKRIVSLLTVAILFSFICLPSHAATSESLAARSGVPDATAFICKKCGSAGHIDSSWLEYNYYGNIMWYYVVCLNCGNTWYYSYQMNAMNDPESPDTETNTVQEPSPEPLVIK